MQVGEVKCAEDVDFERLKQLCRCQDGWKQDYNKHNTTVSSKSNDVSDFKVIKVSEWVTSNSLFHKSWTIKMERSTNIVFPFVFCDVFCYECRRTSQKAMTGSAKGFAK